jgi:hypothetical protein
VLHGFIRRGHRGFVLGLEKQRRDGECKLFISLIVPAGAAFLSLGILDSALDDNTGSFSTTVFEMDDYGFAGDNTFFMHAPLGFTSNAFLGDQTAYKSLVWLAVGLLTLVDIRQQDLCLGTSASSSPTELRILAVLLQELKDKTSLTNNSIETRSPTSSRMVGTRDSFLVKCCLNHLTVRGQ